MYQIKFYQIDKPYGCFSNFSKHPILLKGKQWPTTEHYFQAQKFEGTGHEEELRNAISPMEVARMGREKKRPLRSDWELSKDDIMRDAIKAKIEQHEDVKDILLSTGNIELIEHTKNDSYWADNGDGTGKNMLGKIFMDVRNHHKDYKETFYLPQWLAYPDMHPQDMFWRMGEGESYIINLANWYYGMSERARFEYDRYFSPPEEWRK